MMDAIRAEHIVQRDFRLSDESTRRVKLRFILERRLDGWWCWFDNPTDHRKRDRLDCTTFPLTVPGDLTYAEKVLENWADEIVKVIAGQYEQDLTVLRFHQWCQDRRSTDPNYGR